MYAEDTSTRGKYCFCVARKTEDQETFFCRDLWMDDSDTDDSIQMNEEDREQLFQGSNEIVRA